MAAWGPAALWAAVLFLLSATPDLPGSGLLSRIPGADKVVHALLYAVLGGLLARGRRVGRRSVPHAVLLAAGVLYGASDEWHQSFVPGRDASPADLLADAVGLFLGYALVHRARRA